MSTSARTTKSTPGTSATRSTERRRGGSSVCSGVTVSQSAAWASCHAVGVVGNSL